MVNQSEKPNKYAVMPLTLSFDTLGGIAEPVVLRGTKLPVQRRKEYTTAGDQQSEVTIRLVCGESPIASKNRTIGVLTVDGLPAAVRGGLQILITLEVTTSCRVNLNMTVGNSGIARSVVFTALEKYLTEDKIAKMIERASADQKQDAELLRLLEAKNKADLLISRAEARINTVSGGEERKKIEQAIADLGLAIQSNNPAAILTGVERMERLVPAIPNTDFYSFLFGDMQRTAPKANSNQAVPKPTVSKNNERMASSADQHIPLGWIFGGGKYTLDPGLCFVLMPFLESMRPVYEDHIRPTIKATGLRCLRADELIGTAAITKDVWEHINRARVIVADLTGRNPNVFYEVGLAHAIGKDVILLTQTMDDVPFDLKMLRCIVYSYDPRGIKLMETKLKETIVKMIKSPR